MNHRAHRPWFNNKTFKHVFIFNPRYRLIYFNGASYIFHISVKSFSGLGSNRTTYVRIYFLCWFCFEVEYLARICGSLLHFFPN